MLDTDFLVGFADELTLEKEAGHPLFSAVTRGGTMLGRKVRGMMTRVHERGEKIRMKKKAEVDAVLTGKLNSYRKGTTMEVKPKAPPPPPKKLPVAAPKAKPMPSPKMPAQPMGKLSAAAGEVLRKMSGVPPVPAKKKTTAKPDKLPPTPKMPLTSPKAPLLPKKVPTPMPPARPMGKLSAEKAGRVIKDVLEQASPDAQARKAKGNDGAQVLTQGSADPRYGGGVGNFEGKQAPKFTDKINPTDTPGAY